MLTYVHMTRSSYRLLSAMERAVEGGSRRGVQQQATTYVARRARDESALASYLYREQAWGNMSLAQAHKVASLAREELTRSNASVPRNLDVLAKLGGDADRTANLWRDLERRVAKPFLNVEWLEVPLQEDTGSIPFWPPHTTFQTLKASRPEAFHELVFTSPADVCSFWQSAGNHPCLRHHPVKNIAGYQQRAVPIVLHGDGVPITAIGTSQKSCAFISWRSLLCRHSGSKTQHQLITAVWTDLLQKRTGNGSDTVDAIWRATSASFEEGLARAHNSHEPFPVLCFATGDLEWYSLAHGLPRWNALQPCGLCNTARENMFRFRHIAEVPDQTWHLPRPERNPLLVRTLCKASVFPDLMHTKHLGVDQRLCGSVIWLLVHEIMEGDPKENRRRLIEKLKVAAQNVGRGRRIPSRLTPGMYLGNIADEQCREHYPCLKTKAAETKATAAALVHVWQEYMDVNSEMHVLVNIALELSEFIEETLETALPDWTPRPNTCEKVLQAAISLTQCLTRLTKQYKRDGKCLFQLTFKSHWLIHCMQYGRHLNPCLLWAYSGEDYMGRCKTLLRTCLSGRKQLSALRRFGHAYSRAISAELDFQHERPIFR